MVLTFKPKEYLKCDYLGTFIFYFMLAVLILGLTIWKIVVN